MKRSRGINMNTFKLDPADILVNVNHRHDPFSSVKRWMAGPYEHVFMYMGELIIEIPMLFESAGRGVVLQSLSNRYGEEVVVMRLKSEHDRRRIPYVLDEAIKLASDPQSFYDYLCIPLHIIPRLLHEKFGIPIPLKYHQNEEQVCSEAVFEVFDRAKLPDILRFRTRVPLPGDFVTGSSLLEKVWRGTLSEDLISLE